MGDSTGNTQDKESSGRLHPSSCFRKKSLDYVLAAMSNLGLHKPKKKTSLYDVSFAEAATSRRSSSPCSYRMGSNRSPSPSGYSLEERPFRSRSYSLPLKLQQRRRRSVRLQSDWPIIHSPSIAEQRFLTLPESAYYHKLKAFGVDDSGNIVERGFCYVQKSNTSPTDGHSPTNTSDSTANSGDAPTATDLTVTGDVAGASTLTRHIFNVHVIGEESVGRSSLVEELKNLFLGNLETSEMQADPDGRCVIPVLVEGNEYYLNFKRGNTVPEKLTSKDDETAVIVMYDVTSAETFSAAADIMYVITSEVDDPKNEVYVPMLLIGNKADLERHRAIEHSEGKELAKSYGCAFLEVSVLLGHQVEAVLQVLLNELRPTKKMRRKRSIYRARKRSRPKNVMAKSEFHMPSPAWFDFLRKRQKCVSLESLF